MPGSVTKPQREATEAVERPKKFFELPKAEQIRLQNEGGRGNAAGALVQQAAGHVTGPASGAVNPAVDPELEQISRSGPGSNSQGTNLGSRRSLSGDQAQGSRNAGARSARLTVVTTVDRLHALMARVAELGLMVANFHATAIGPLQWRFVFDGNLSGSVATNLRHELTADGYQVVGSSPQSSTAETERSRFTASRAPSTKRGPGRPPRSDNDLQQAKLEEAPERGLMAMLDRHDPQRAADRRAKATERQRRKRARDQSKLG